jgi:hypothetical protein
MTFQEGAIGYVSQELARDSACGRYYGRFQVLSARREGRYWYFGNFINDHGDVYDSSDGWYVVGIDGPDPCAVPTIDLIEEPAGPVGSW